MASAPDTREQTSLGGFARDDARETAERETAERTVNTLV
jgi:hypothetical protein